ncbi:hypothetical protein Vafri_11128 [Volvox africanus]|uniref:Uncharacterized protein n=1 Tax=Volvox africanus TaxID=51714 RepID=A0A8J4B7J7_9CHLO|nr:hypothetical protein Vafri_11128 [Volvox africanus]
MQLTLRNLKATLLARIPCSAAAVATAADAAVPPLPVIPLPPAQVPGPAPAHTPAATRTLRASSPPPPLLPLPLPDPARTSRRPLVFPLSFVPRCPGSHRVLKPSPRHAMYSHIPSPL